MGIIKKVAIGVGGLVGVLVVAGVGGYVWAGNASATQLARTVTVPTTGFPMPWPAGADSAGGADTSAMATTAAIARGKHLIEARYPCAECHGADFGGGTMVDDPAMGQILGPNLTTGAGSRTASYTAEDWDRIVRHGVKPDGTRALMPSEDFFAMSDRELSDVVMYIRSLPPVDKTVPVSTLGPVAKALVATGKWTFSADMHPTKHEGAHAALPPAEVADATFGKHLVQGCTGCHRANLAGGPIVAGPPNWPPAANLTPAGLTGWSYDDFVRAMREGVRKDGTPLREPMSVMPKFAKNMTDVELQALWAYISTVPAVESAPAK